MYGAPASIIIGGPVVGGTANRVLFIGATGNLADDADLTFDGAILTIGKTGRLMSASPSIPASGTSLELYYAADTFTGSPTAYVISFDRTASVYKPFAIDALTITLRTSGNAAITLDTSNNATLLGHLLRTGTTQDIGASGSGWRTGYFGTSVQIEANNGLKLTNQSDGAGASTGTLTNAPSAGNPSFWLPVTVNGNNRFVPCWT